MSFPPLAFDNRLAYSPVKRISLSIATAKNCCAEIPVVDCNKLLPPYLAERCISKIEPYRV
jgi:hypothetical protein